MKRLLALGGFVLACIASTGRAETPALLQTAINRLVADDDRWAYTQRVRSINDGKTVDDRLERFDPSKPDDEQWQLLEIAGQAPTEAQRKSWLRKKRKAARSRKNDTLADVIDLERATVASETVDSVRFAVPLRATDNNRFPPEKFEAIAQIGKARGDFESFELRLKDPFRVKSLLGVAKVNAVEAAINFAVVDEQHAPPVTSIRASGSGRILFVKVGGAAQITRSEFKRVKPYKERFWVKIGDIKALDF